MLILHITQADQWQQAQQVGLYRSETLDSEGFIHCSTPSQVTWVANTFFHDQQNLRLLCIEEERVQAEVRYEAVGDDAYPHIYGALNLDAVTEVLDIEPEPDGSFQAILPRLRASL